MLIIFWTDIKKIPKYMIQIRKIEIEKKKKRNETKQKIYSDFNFDCLKNIYMNMKKQINKIKIR